MPDIKGNETLKWIFPSPKDKKSKDPPKKVEKPKPNRNVKPDCDCRDCLNKLKFD